MKLVVKLVDTNGFDWNHYPNGWWWKNIQRHRLSIPEIQYRYHALSAELYSKGRIIAKMKVKEFKTQSSLS